MRKITLFLFSLLALLASVTTAQAQEMKSPYKVDFNSAIATDDHAFLVDVGWDHAVGSVESSTGYDKYVPYTYKADGGKDGGYLSVGNQLISIGGGFGEDYAYDYLVTPSITGASSIFVKKEKTYNDFITIYKMKKVNGKYVTDGNPIYASSDDEDFTAATDWYEVNIPEVNNVRLGIYASNVGIDNFEAENAKIEPKRSMSISSSSSMGTYLNADQDGNYTLTFNVTVKNTGGAALNPGDTGYQVDIKNQAGTIVKTIPIDKTLGAGESYTIPVSVTLNIQDYPDASYYYAYEGISETKTTIGKITPVAYTPIMKMTYGGKEITDDFTINFGSIKKAKTEEITIANDGGKDLVVSQLNLSEGFTTNAILPLTVKPHESAKINVTMNTDSQGAKTGSLEVISDGGNKTIALKGVVLDATTWYEDFESGKLPAGMIIVGKEDIWTVTSRPYSLKTDENAKALKAYAYGSESATAISPLLEIKEGESLSFDMARVYSSKGNLIIKYSTNRKDWTTVKEFTVDDFSADKVSYDYKFAPVTIDGIPAGKYYIGFESTGCYIDNIAGFKLADVAHDWIITSSTIEEKGEVNSVLKASASMQNTNVKDEEADSYTATLYVDGKAAATAKAEAIEAGETQTFNFNYTPHQAGTFKAYIEIASGEYKVASDETEIIVSEEKGIADKQIGEPSTRSYNVAPMSIYNSNSEAVLLYPASKLNSLTKGDKITKISFKGIISSTNSLNGNPQIKAWIANTSDATLEKPASSPSTEGMTQIFDGEYEFKTVGNSNDSFDKDADIFVIELAEPFVYNGEGITMVFSSQANGWASVKFQCVNNDEKLAYMDKSDSALKGSFTSTALPVVHFGVTYDPITVTGTVTDKTTHKAIANAEVKLVADNVEYTAKTDETGKYSVEVIKVALSYEAVITAEGYKTVNETAVNLNTENNFTLESTVPSAIQEVEAAKISRDHKVYNTQGILVSKNGLAGLKAGMYIVNGKKVIIK